MKKLTRKQQAFADFLLTDKSQNQTKAYQHAYPNSSEKAAASAAVRLLRNVKVAAYLEKMKAERSKRTNINADWLLNRLAEEAEADVADIYCENTGALKPVHDWPLIWRQGLVGGIEVLEEFEGSGADRIKIGETTKVKLSDRIRRLEMLGKHISVKAFEEQVKHDVTDTLADLLKQVKPKTLDPQ
jgi:phage terminase small subunit